MISTTTTTKKERKKKVRFGQYKLESMVGIRKDKIPGSGGNTYDCMALKGRTSTVPDSEQRGSSFLSPQSAVCPDHIDSRIPTGYDSNTKLNGYTDGETDRHVCRQTDR